MQKRASQFLDTDTGPLRQGIPDFWAMASCLNGEWDGTGSGWTPPSGSCRSIAQWEEAPPLEADRAGPFKAQSTGHFSGLRTVEIIILIVIFSNVNGVFIYYGSVLSPLCIHLILITTQRRGTFTIIPI